MIANTLNAGADIGAIAAGINLLVPIPATAMIVPIALVILGLQVWGSYRLIARTFKWLTLALFAYFGSALYARPDLAEVLRGTSPKWHEIGSAEPVALGRKLENALLIGVDHGFP